MIELSVIIPTHNRADRLRVCLEALSHQTQPATDFEVIVVDDGSTDGTARVVEAFRPPADVAMRLVRLGRNRGKGAGVRAGLAASCGEHVLISDADLSAPIEEVEALLESGADVAVGSRGVRRELIMRHQPLARDTMGRIFNLALRLLGLTRLKDTQCGFKLLEGGLARRLAGTLRLDGFAYDVELLARAERSGATVAEVPVRWYHVEASRVRPLRHGFQMLRDALRVRAWLWLGR